MKRLELEEAQQSIQKEVQRAADFELASRYEIAGRFEDAASIYERYGFIERAGSIRGKMYDKRGNVVHVHNSSIKIENAPIEHAVIDRRDQSTSSTIIRDSVVSRSSIGSGTKSINACPYCGEDINLPKAPRFCPYCKEPLS